MGEEILYYMTLFPYIYDYLKKKGFFDALQKVTGLRMPEFPTTVRVIGKRVVKEALTEQGYTKERAEKIDKVESIKQVVGPVTGSVDVTADETEITLIDTSTISLVTNKPHELMGSIDVSDFVAKAPDGAQIEIRWYVDGILYIRDSFYKEDLVDEKQIVIPGGRRAHKHHKITIVLHGSGASDTNPITLNYGFSFDVGFLPIAP